jgi:kinetochor protein Mis14/NSL1
MLYMQHEQETTRVAEMRRDAPGAAARAYMERLNKEMQADREVNTEEGDEMQGVIDLGGLERRDEVERMWGRGLDGLVALEGITEVGARLERAKWAVEVVEGM